MSDSDVSTEEFTPEAAAPTKTTMRYVRFPAAVTYFREEMDGAVLNGLSVAEHTRIHVDGLGHMSIGTAKALTNSLTAAVRLAEQTDRKRAAEAQGAAAAAGTGDGK